MHFLRRFLARLVGKPVPIQLKEGRYYFLGTGDIAGPLAKCHPFNDEYDWTAPVLPPHMSGDEQLCLFAGSDVGTLFPSRAQTQILFEIRQAPHRAADLAPPPKPRIDEADTDEAIAA